MQTSADKADNVYLINDRAGAVILKIVTLAEETDAETDSREIRNQVWRERISIKAFDHAWKGCDGFRGGKTQQNVLEHKPHKKKEKQEHPDTVNYSRLRTGGIC